MRALMALALLTILAVRAEEPVHIPVRKTDTYEKAAINVRDFGARGDGRTDDTEAIRAAVKAAFERRRIPQHPEHGYFVSFAEVYFPAGHYLVSDMIDINAVKLRGENYAAVEQTDPEKDIFHNAWAWRQLIEGLTLLGGRSQLNLGNGNVDTGHVTVRDCQFYGSSGPAVQMRKGSNSTFFKVENCVFRECEQALVAWCDMTVLRDCWISTSPDMRNKAAIENHGCLHVDNLLGVPRVKRGQDGFSEQWTDPNGRVRTAANQRWIDNYGVVHIRNSRFGGEGGGFAAVYNFAHFDYEYPVIPNSVTIESSYLYNAQSTAVVLVEIPNMVTVRNCTGLVDAWILRVNPELDLVEYLQPKGRPLPLRFDIEGNYGGFGPGLPEALLPYLNRE